MKFLIFVFVSFFFFLNQNIIAQNPGTNPFDDFPIIKGPYLGQKPPGTAPEVFAPGIVSTGLYTRDIAIMPDGKEIYYCVSAVGYNIIFYTKQVNGIWTEPQPAPFIENFEHMYYEPCISHDGKKLFFLSNRPKNDSEKEGNEDIWVVNRQGDTWRKGL